MKKSRPLPILHDPLIIPRVKQYLEENVHQTYVDVSVMARELQDRYREYSRRKTVPFRLLVEQAYKTVLQSYGLDSNPSSDGDANSDLELMDDAVQPNHMNDTLNNMYMKNKSKNSSQTNEEAIDISSDESDNDVDELPTTTSKTLNSNNADYNIRGVTITKVQKQLTSTTSNSAGDGKKTSTDKDRKEREKNKYLERDIERDREQIREINSQSQNSGGKKRRYDGSSIPTEQGSFVPSASVKPKKYKNIVLPRWVSLKFKDVGGMEKILKELCELLLHIKHPQVYEHIGLPPPRGFLLHGPPGSGKTLLANAIAGQLQIPLLCVTATELIAGVSGESEERIREVFEQALAVSPCVLFIDEVDAISSNRQNASKDMERRVVTQLISCLDNLSMEVKGNQVLVIGATNRPDALDPALRRVGRFDQEISLGIPDCEAREQILRIICDPLSIHKPFDFKSLATLTPGYVGADLLALATRAASTAVKKVFTKRGEDAVEKRLLQDQKTKSVILPIVNLTDDSLLMEVDDVTETSKATDALNKEKSTVKTNETEPTIVTETKAIDDDVQEISTGIDITGTGIQENDIKIPSIDNVADKVNVENQDVTSEVKSPETSDESAIPTPIPEKTDEVMKETIVNEEEAMESNDLPSKIQENGTEPIVDKSNIEAEIEEDTLSNDLINEIANLAENLINEVKTDETKSNDLKEAVLQQPGVKLQLTLNEMIKWLSNKGSPVYGKDLDNICITMDDFMEALKFVQPSAKREGFITVPDVTWDDIGSLRDIREELKLAVLAPVKFPQKLKMLGLTAPSGVLLCGPPGCGKTLLAKAVANEAGINFISVKGPELLNMYVGESERAVRLCFQRARNSAPCVIFFDEFDSLCPKRSDSGEGGAGARVVNQLLTEMDGIEERKGVFLMAATNRPDMVDPAVLRPGRLDKILYVGLPSEPDRVDILQALTKNRTKPLLAQDVNFEELALLTNCYTGADLAGLVRQSSLHALKDYINLNQIDTEDNAEIINVTKDHFLKALNQLKPSVSVEDRKHYEKLREKYAAPNQLKSNITI